MYTLWINSSNTASVLPLRLGTCSLSFTCARAHTQRHTHTHTHTYHLSTVPHLPPQCYDHYFTPFSLKTVHFPVAVLNGVMPLWNGCLKTYIFFMNKYSTNTLALIFLILDHLIFLSISEFKIWSEDEYLLHISLEYLAKTKSTIFWPRCLLNQNEYFKMSCTSFTFSFPNTFILFFLSYSEAHFFHLDSPNIPFIDLLQLSVIFQECNTWNCLLYSLCRYTMLWYKNRIKLPSFFILNAKQFT